MQLLAIAKSVPLGEALCNFLQLHCVSIIVRQVERKFTESNSAVGQDADAFERKIYVLPY